MKTPGLMSASEALTTEAMRKLSASLIITSAPWRVLTVSVEPSSETTEPRTRTVCVACGKPADEPKASVDRAIATAQVKERGVSLEKVIMSSRVGKVVRARKHFTPAEG